MKNRQLEFDRKKLVQKRFSLSLMVNAKLNSIAKIMDKLSHSDVVWLSKVEDFFHQNEYLTERQTEVLDSILKRHLV